MITAHAPDDGCEEACPDCGQCTCNRELAKTDRGLMCAVCANRGLVEEEGYEIEAYDAWRSRQNYVQHGFHA